MYSTSIKPFVNYPWYSPQGLQGTINGYIPPQGLGVSEFSPLDLNPLRWHDVSDSDTVTESSGSISQIDDKSGNGIHLVQATGSLQPQLQSAHQNGLDTALFDGTDDTMKSASSITENAQVNTVYIVVRMASASGTDNVFDGYGGTDRSTLFANSGTRWALFAGSTLSDGASDLINNSNYYIIKCIFNGSSSEIITDNTTDVGPGNAGADGMAGLTLGSRQDGAQCSNIYLGEIIWFDGEITGGDDTNMWTFLNNKWAVY